MLNNNDFYQDTSENFLLNFFDKPQSKKQEEIYKILENNPPWPILYHLHPQREFILSWYPFKKNSTLLEVGAGCGAITGILCDKLKEVHANELTKKRAEIIKKRFSDKKNLKILSGNINKFMLNKQFDYITLIGVLEYQGRYTKTKNKFSDSPYICFLKNIKKFLKKDGILLIAIENKISLKFLAGGKEDHYGNLFESVENYPNYDGIKTFTKNEIKDILNQVGFKKINFYYPFPDYKLPSIIFSEEGIKNLKIPLSTYIQIIDKSNPRDFLFNEVVYGYLIKRENILDKFSNSFLIEAKI